MKGKPLVYLLGFLVLCIWGMVLYRVFVSVHEETGIQSDLTATAPLKKTALPKLYPDTFHLILDYPDPFSGAPVKLPDTSVSGKVVIKPAQQPQQVVPVPQNPVQLLKYLGFVSDGKGNQRVAIVSFQGTERLLKEGDTLKRIKVINIKKDALVLSYQGKTTSIKTE
ncbi:MAG: hypothetical protein V4594_17815 [Bacteroidota bacterium]